MQNLLRQIKDIQFQAEKLISGNPSVEDVGNFGKYSHELCAFINDCIDIPEVLKLVEDVPEIEKMKISAKAGLLASLLPGFLFVWYYEHDYVSKSKDEIRTIRGKFASIEFILKNYFS